MKTTIELPDKLLVEAKAVAARRKTTLRAIIEHALRREIYGNQAPSQSGKGFSIDEQGLPVLKKEGDTVVTSEMVYDLMDELGV